MLHRVEEISLKQALKGIQESKRVYGISTLIRRYTSYLSLWSLALIALIVLAGSDQALAITTGDLKDVVEGGESFLNGGIVRLGLFAGTGVAGIAAAWQQSVVGVVICLVGAFFIYLMHSWIDTNFAMVI